MRVWGISLHRIQAQTNKSLLLLFFRKEESSLPSCLRGSAPDQPYFHNDHQNTNGIDTSDTCAILQKKGADVFGQSRQENRAVGSAWTGDSVTTRRYIIRRIWCRRT